VFFDEFLARLKSAKNLKYRRLWQRKKRLDDFFGGVGRRGGAPGRRKRRGYVAGEHSVKDSARRSTGGGGSKGYRLCRRPLRDLFLFWASRFLFFSVCR
jgi:hypothetical protein